MVENNELVPLEAAQARQAGEMLARAFHNDPLFMMVIPGAGKRTKVLSWLFGRVVHCSLLYGETHTIGTLEGVACWLPPGRNELTIGRIVRSGLYAMPLKMGLAAYRRFDGYMNYAERLHRRCAPESHWYLWAVGVESSSQGKGIGSRLMEPVLRRASVEGIACYLETGVESNIRFYEKHGFEVVEEGRVPGHDVPVWAMLCKGKSA